MILTIKRRLQILEEAFTQELRKIFTDKGAILILLIAPLIYPVIYSIAYKNNEIKDMPIGVVDLDRSALSRSYVLAADESKKISVAKEFESIAEAKQDFWRQHVRGILVIPSGFEQNILRQEPTTISVYSDASCFMVYKETLLGIWQTTELFSNSLILNKLKMFVPDEETAKFITTPIKSEMTKLFNPNDLYGSYVMPGIIILILQQTLLVGIGYVGGAHREDSNPNSRNAGLSLIANSAFRLIGRAIAYLLPYLFISAFVFIVLPCWFSYPVAENILHTFLPLLPYLLAVIFLGLAISTMFHRREHAIMFMVFLSPIIFFMSGVSWPLNAIPNLVVVMFKVFPSSIGISVISKIQSVNPPLNLVASQIQALFMMTALYFILAVIIHVFFTRKEQILK